MEPGAGKPAINGSALEELARQYVLASNVINRLGNWMDPEALRALSDGIVLNLDSAPRAGRTKRAGDAGRAAQHGLKRRRALGI